MLSVKDNIRNYAIDKHGLQLYGNHPYVYHLDRVYEEAVYYGLPLIVQLAAYGHDLFEDTPVIYEEFVKEFGEELAELIRCVTDEPGKNRKERKAATYPKIKRNSNAIALKLCDRIANVKACLELKNMSLLSMYQKEQPQFEAHLKNAEDYQSMWNDLTILLNQGLVL